MSFNIIACIGKNGELGIKNQLVFHIKEDMEFFKNTTVGHSVLMGKNTFKSIGSPLQGRKNLIVTHHSETLGKDVFAITDLNDFIKQYQFSDEKIFVIGGASIYQALLPYTEIIYLTEVDASPKADVYFPKLNLDLYDKIILKESVEGSLKYKFTKYTKKEVKWTTRYST